MKFNKLILISILAACVLTLTTFKNKKNFKNNKKSLSKKDSNDDEDNNNELEVIIF